MIYSFFNSLKIHNSLSACFHRVVDECLCLRKKKKHIHEVAGSKSYVKAGYSNFLELPRPAQILWESFASN